MCKLFLSSCSACSTNLILNILSKHLSNQVDRLHWSPPSAFDPACQTTVLQRLACCLQVGHLEHFDALQEQLQQGHNVVLLANHQTEADPGVWALLLEKTHPQLATDIIYVAGQDFCMLLANEGAQCS